MVTIIVYAPVGTSSVLGAGAVASIIISAVLAVAAVIVTITIICLRRRKRKTNREAIPL